MRQYARGITLIETMIVVLLIGVMSVMILPSAQLAAGVADQTSREQQRMINSRIVNGLLAYAKGTAYGTLPDPYSSGAAAKQFVANPSDSNVVNQLLLAGVDYRQINDDGLAARHVRVFQKVAGLTQTTPIYSQSGPTVVLTYQYGVVYSTDCIIAAACFTGQSIPGTSSALTASNFSSWSLSGSDLAAVFVSTLPLQKQMLDLTVKRLERVRDALISNFSARVMLATPSDTTNWHPAGATSLAGQTPGTNQGCRDGWYDLSATNVLDQVGLTAAEYGVTAWGGPVQYCRDYDPTGTSGANTVPHYAALRILRDVGGGGSPDPAIAGNNVLISL